MKTTVTILIAGLFIASCAVHSPANSQVNQRAGQTVKQKGISNSIPLPNGTYYIVQVASGKAITPKGITQVTNEIYLDPFNRGGLQKWLIKKQTNGRYIFQPEGNLDLYFTTFADSPNWTAITGNKLGDTYTLKAVSGSSTYFTIHSKYYNGDALKSTIVGGYEEIKFAPLENNDKFYWEFILVE